MTTYQHGISAFVPSLRQFPMIMEQPQIEFLCPPTPELFMKSRSYFAIAPSILEFQTVMEQSQAEFFHLSTPTLHKNWSLCVDAETNTGPNDDLAHSDFAVPACGLEDQSLTNPGYSYSNNDLVFKCEDETQIECLCPSTSNTYKTCCFNGIDPSATESYKEWSVGIDVETNPELYDDLEHSYRFVTSYEIEEQTLNNPGCSSSEVDFNCKRKQMPGCFCTSTNDFCRICRWNSSTSFESLNQELNSNINYSAS